MWSYPEDMIDISIPVVAHRYIIQTVVEYILLRNARVKLAIIKVETMIEITIQFYIWKQIVHLWEKSYGSQWFEASFYFYKIVKYFKYIFVPESSVLYFKNIAIIFNPTLLSQLILPEEGNFNFVLGGQGHVHKYFSIGPGFRIACEIAFSTPFSISINTFC